MPPIFELYVRRWQARFPVGYRAMLFSPVEATLTRDLVRLRGQTVPPISGGESRASNSSLAL